MKKNDTKLTLELHLLCIGIVVCIYIYIYAMNNIWHSVNFRLVQSHERITYERI